jgi:dTDP-D-glucose 4,6-dehydratase
MLSQIMGFHGSIEWDKSRPNGQPRRFVDSTKAFEEFSFKAQIPLSQGLRKTIDWYNKEQLHLGELSSDQDRTMRRDAEATIFGLAAKPNPN